MNLEQAKQALYDEIRIHVEHGENADDIPLENRIMSLIEAAKKEGAGRISSPATRVVLHYDPDLTDEITEIHYIRSSTDEWLKWGMEVHFRDREKMWIPKTYSTGADVCWNLFVDIGGFKS